MWCSAACDGTQHHGLVALQTAHHHPTPLGASAMARRGLAAAHVLPTLQHLAPVPP